MPDWRQFVRARLAGLPIRPVDELEIVEELAQHVEARYDDLIAGGMDEQLALGKSLEELDGESLQADLLDALTRKP